MPELSVQTLPLLPLTSGVVLPGMVVTATLETAESRAAATAARDAGQLLVLVPKVGERYARVGTVAEIEETGELPSGQMAIVVRGLHRARISTGVAGTGSATWVEIERIHEPEPTPRTRELAREYRAVIESIHVDERLEKVLGWARDILAELELKDRIRKDVSEGMEKTQREFILRQQLAAIRKELGDADEAESVVAGYRKRLQELGAGVPEDARKAIEREIDRLERTPEQNPEHGWIRTWLDTVTGLPWGKRSDDRLDISEARRVLDEDHNGLEDVKDRIIEYLAVRKLRADRGIEQQGGRGSGTIIALVGPPGVGKTSLGESVARAMGRSFVRVALGGIHDEAEIRGHRRTYVGAQPGRIARAITEAGTMNPVFLLDEVDKVGADWRGDPSSPLLDRMEVVRLDGYTEEEKVAIARDHLFGRRTEQAGLRPDEVVLTTEALRGIVSDYTREAGVRNLEREIGRLLRKVATRLAAGEVTAPVVIDAADVRGYLGRQRFFFEAAERTAVPGVATGLAVTGVGGDVLFVEASVMDGEPGLTLTGQLGDVMKESASIALSYVRAHAGDLGIGEPVERRRVHLHVPAGAVPKDGPSAGVTMTTALVSLLTGRPGRSEVGMTGEVTLQGRVLPIGGVKQKVLAAHRAGLKEVILPSRNGGDLDDVPESVRDEMTFHLADEIGQVLDLALASDEATAGGEPAEQAA